jgi:PAS domain S-box-containing protein
MEDHLKTKAQLIAELQTLRAEIAAYQKTRETKISARKKRKKIINSIAISIRNCLNVDEILNTTVTEIRNILESDRVIIYQFQADGTGLVVKESAADPAISIFGWVIKEECFPEMWIEPYKQGRTRTINDVQTDPSLTECHREFLTSLMIRANLIVPIIQGENLWGLLIAHQCTAPRDWTTADIELMSQLAIQVGIAIKQASLIEKLQVELKQRTQTEIMLQEQEKQLELFIQYAPAAIAMFDKNMQYVMASQRWIDDYELESIAAIIGKSHYEIFPEIPDQWRQVHQNCLNGASQKCDEDLFIRADGLNQWLRWEVRPWCNINNEICGIIIFSENITARKQAELALRKFHLKLEQEVAERTIQLAQVNDHLQRELLQQERLERELIKRQKLLDGFFYAASQANVGLSILDSQLCFLKINQVLADINGYSVEAHLGKTPMDLIPEITATVLPILQNVRDTKQPVSNLEISGIVPSQPEEIRYWLVSYFPILGETENALAIGSIVVEITQRKRLEIEREKLIGIIEATSDIIGTVRFATQKTEYVNKAGRNLLGLTDDAPVDHISIADVHPQWALEIVQNQGIPTAVKKGVWVGETAFLNHEGKEIPTSQVLIAQTFGINHTQYLSTIARDITEQKQLEATLKESDRRWKSLLDNVQLIVIGLDIYGNIEYANPFFLQLTNYTKEEVLGKNWFDNFLPPNQKNILQNSFKEVIENNFYSHYQNPILNKSGDEIIISWSNTLLRDVAGNAIGTISIGEDITERYKLERMKAEFISVVSHELRTPLTSMQAGLSLLNDKIIDPNSPEGEATIEIATAGVDRLVRLVNDILDLERLESGKINLEKKIYNTAELINLIKCKIWQLKE